MSGNHRLSAPSEDTRPRTDHDPGDGADRTIIGSNPAWVVRRRPVLDYEQGPDGTWREAGPPSEVSVVEPWIVTPDLSRLIEDIAAEIPEP